MTDPELNTPKPELDARINKFQAYIQDKNMDGVLILQKSDLFYFTGTIQDSWLYIPAEGLPVLMVKKSAARAQAESELDKIIPLKSSAQIPEILRLQGFKMPVSLGMELDVLPANLFFSYQKLFKNCEIADISHEIRMLRAVKSDYEINMIKKAAQLADLVLENVKELIWEGMQEVELAGLVESAARKLGHQGTARMRLWGSELFYGHLMAGPSAAVPSFLSSPTGGTGTCPAVAQGAGFNLVKSREPILVDYVFAFNGYMSDQTRIFSIGELPDELVNAHKAMLDVQEMLQKEAKPGVKAGELYNMAVERASELGYADNFMGSGSDRIRFVGHGLGIELDEYPFIAKGQELTLQKNMVIALEPKLIFPDKGVVGIENTHLVVENGLEQLTKFGDEIILV
ncbi:Amidopeptidase [Desulfonema limicola]|uniref:Amidopeptidase n=1 Tax=Desulfonema limicola TaxID=45656 RepID=A0A975B9H6_9BACT|nr:Xaa-Pro peptidase family protein [Desulfonema limicola]QTA81156.1 Amidopeptidase [Desulfonema limicola]